MAKQTKTKPGARERFDQLACDQWGLDECLDHATQFSDLGFVDSLDIVEFVMAIEEEFDVEISDEAMAGAEKLGDLWAIVCRKTGAEED